MEEWVQALASVLVAIIVSVPGIIALLRQRSKEEADTKKVKSDAKKVDVEIADVVQGVYQGIITDLTKKTEESKQEITKMSKQMEEIIEQNTKLIQQNRELRLTNELLVVKIDRLSNGVKILIDQLRREGHSPEFELSDDLKDEF